MRDPGLLDSALAAPQASFDGRLLHDNLHEIAAAYAFHIIGNHPFLDGNKRIGLEAALLFLRLNEVEMPRSERFLVRAGLTLAQGRMTITRLARLLRSQAER